VTRPGRYYPLEGAHAHPAPEPAPRILIGAGSRRGVRMAARIGDGWAAEMGRFEELLPAYREALEAEGRTVDSDWIAIGFGGGRTGRDALRDSEWVSEPGKAWSRYAAMGVDEVAVTARTTNDIDALVRAAERW